MSWGQLRSQVTLTPPEKNYTITERECLAIVFAPKKIDMYSDGASFTVQTRHAEITGNQLAHDLAREINSRASMIPWPYPPISDEAHFYKKKS